MRRAPTRRPAIALAAISPDWLAKLDVGARVRAHNVALGLRFAAFFQRVRDRLVEAERLARCPGRAQCCVVGGACRGGQTSRVCAFSIRDERGLGAPGYFLRRTVETGRTHELARMFGYRAHAEQDESGILLQTCSAHYLEGFDEALHCACVVSLFFCRGAGAVQDKAGPILIPQLPKERHRSRVVRSRL